MPKGMPRGKSATPSEYALLGALGMTRAMLVQVDRQKIEALSDAQRALLTEELRRANDALSWLVHHFQPTQGAEESLRELRMA